MFTFIRQFYLIKFLYGGSVHAAYIVLTFFRVRFSIANTS